MAELELWWIKFCGVSKARSGLSFPGIPYTHVLCCPLLFSLIILYGGGNTESVRSQYGVHPVFVSPDPIYSVAGRLRTFHSSQSGGPHPLSHICVYIYMLKLAASSKILSSDISAFYYRPSLSVVQNEAVLGPSGLTFEHRYHIDGCLSCISVLWIQPSRYGRCAHPRVLREGVSSVRYHQHHWSPKQIQREYSRFVVALLLDYTFIRSYP
jgi:hypothetical protein